MMIVVIEMVIDMVIDMVIVVDLLVDGHMDGHVDWDVLHDWHFLVDWDMDLFYVVMVMGVDFVGYMDHYMFTMVWEKRVH